MFNQERANELIPEHMHGALKRYIDDGILPGGFLSAVLQNNLKEAVGRADHLNMDKLPDYIRFLYNFAPSPCWGSEEKVSAWIEMHEHRMKSNSSEPDTAKGSGT